MDIAKTNQEPLFSCVNCYETYSWPASDLAVYKGECWCQNCFEQSDMAYGDDAIDWHDLEPFVPEYVKQIDALKAEIAEVRRQMKGVK